MKILLIEDNQNIAKGLIYSLEQNKYQIIHLQTVAETKQYLANNTADLIILDVGLPDGNGFELYQNIKKEYEIPTIFLTARDEENDIVTGLELGAEDYITKPFSTRELLARIHKALLRNQKDSKITIQDITCDLEKMCIYKQKEEIPFSSLELKIILLLFQNINKVVTREMIIEKIWEWTGNDVFDNTVTVYLKRIREKLSTDIITTIKGVGYRIDEK